jgi:hypothetical protein
MVERGIVSLTADDIGVFREKTNTLNTDVFNDNITLTLDTITVGDFPAGTLVFQGSGASAVAGDPQGYVETETPGTPGTLLLKTLANSESFTTSTDLKTDGGGTSENVSTVSVQTLKYALSDLTTTNQDSIVDALNEINDAATYTINSVSPDANGEITLVAGSGAAITPDAANNQIEIGLTGGGGSTIEVYTGAGTPSAFSSPSSVDQFRFNSTMTVNQDGASSSDIVVGVDESGLDLKNIGNTDNTSFFKYALEVTLQSNGSALSGDFKTSGLGVEYDTLNFDDKFGLTDASGTVTVTLAPNKITATEILVGTITGTEIADDAISSNHLADGIMDGTALGAAPVADDRILIWDDTGVSGSKIKYVTITQLSNAVTTTFTVTDGSNPFTIQNGDTFEFKTVAGRGLSIDTSVADEIDIDMALATDTVIGTAKFTLNDFDVVAGQVSLPDANATAAKGITASNLHDTSTGSADNIIKGMTTITNVATDDEVLISDTSDSNKLKSATVSSFSVIGTDIITARRHIGYNHTDLQEGYGTTVDPVGTDTEDTQANGSIGGITITNGGSGYAEGDRITLSSAGGIDAILVVVAVSSGAVVQAHIYNAGTLYAATPTPDNLTQASTSGSGINFTCDVKTEVNLGDVAFDTGGGKNQAIELSGLTAGKRYVFSVHGEIPNTETDSTEYIPIITIRDTDKDGKILYASGTEQHKRVKDCPPISVGNVVLYIPSSGTLHFGLESVHDQNLNSGSIIGIDGYNLN